MELHAFHDYDCTTHTTFFFYTTGCKMQRAFRVRKPKCWLSSKFFSLKKIVMKEAQICQPSFHTAAVSSQAGTPNYLYSQGIDTTSSIPPI